MPIPDKPPEPCHENRIHPIRVFTLGRFSILKDGDLLTFQGKPQKKPINLLKALIACGGRSVSIHNLAVQLWEEGETCDARHALDMAISRLRKLLDHENVIHVQDGKISLNNQHVWVDADMFERAVGKHETLLPDYPEDARLRLGEKAIDHYNGIFLQGDDESPWLLGRRDRLHSRFLRLVIRHGNHLEQAGMHAQAKTCYLKALELDPLAEEIYQCLMKCLINQGEYAQALETYRRCRKMLSIVLGIAPSQRTDTLAEQARSGSPSS